MDKNSNNRGISLFNWVNKNKIKFKMSLQGPESPTFPAGGSYLDLVIRDARISVTNEINKKIRVLAFDSDHNALFFIIKIDNVDKFLFTENINTNRFNFHKTNWKKYTENK